MAVMHQAIHAIHGLVVLLLSGVFIYNLVNGISGLNQTVQSFSAKTNSSLVPPAVTLCINNPNYNFSITVYGVKRVNKDFLFTYAQDSGELAAIRELVAKCWIFTTGTEPLIQSPPPTPNVPDMVLTYTRGLLSQNDTNSPMYLNVFDPLERSSLFQYNQFLYLEADANRVISFSRTQHKDKNGVKHDIKYSIMDEYRDPSWTSGLSATSNITIRADSFIILQTEDNPRSTGWSIFRESFTLFGVLYSFYLALMGPGKFRPWGLLHKILNYHHIEHIPYRNVSDDRDSSPIAKETGALTNEPRIEERLDIYLSRFDRAKYH
ncbi:2151_t:CDS:2 [Ambispora gerdemannii]|uniref:2151_t:CDS:1 n=1 Tax=Ambispora gerdemannii TaxID=144530 RepID=A0A9N8V968_9GLOM|nr:2151_t:CDS:2 [Ambispora gerdemannii]